MKLRRPLLTLTLACLLLLGLAVLSLQDTEAFSLLNLVMFLLVPAVWLGGTVWLVLRRARGVASLAGLMVGLLVVAGGVHVVFDLSNVTSLPIENGDDAVSVVQSESVPGTSRTVEGILASSEAANGDASDRWETERLNPEWSGMERWEVRWTPGEGSQLEPLIFRVTVTGGVRFEVTVSGARSDAAARLRALARGSAGA
ncbi:MAG TPA: hypothetical protein VFE20_07625 [Thermoleophilia bacterium]|nr:hypothetical protein [Thermoleophilia bacterium]